jgi:hypothetical protein
MGRVAILALAGLVTTTLLLAQESRRDYRKTRIDEVTALIPRLEELAGWAATEKLYRERDRINGLIVSLDGNHATARSSLQYKKKPDGTWTRPPTWREAKNASEKALPEYAQRRATIADPVAERLLAALDVEKATMEAATRKVWFDEIMAIAPDSARIRGLLGEKKLGERWVLGETATAVERRREVAGFAKALREEKKGIQDDVATPFEAGLKLKWITWRRTRHVRLASTVPQPEVDTVLSECDTAWRLAHKLVGAEPDEGVVPSIVLFNDAEELLVYLAAHEETPPEWRVRATANFTLGISGNILVGDTKAPARLLSARSRIATMAVEFALKTGLLPGWLHEVNAAYVNQLMTGGFQPYYGDWNRAGALSEFVKQARAPKANWLEAAAGLVKEPKAPTLAYLAARTQFEVNSVDSLVLTAFAAYMIEGRPEDVPLLWRAFQRHQDGAGAVREALKLELPELEQRFHRWLAETIVPAPKR